MSYVVSYYNPDLDGVASAVALSSLLTATKTLVCTPLALGSCDAETTFVFDLLKLKLPQVVNECPVRGQYFLVDTHHVDQLKGRVPLDRVIEIYDHHPAGTPAAFPRANIRNEAVGAVATLITERFREADVALSTSLAALLYAAIVSNTMNFAAPTSTERDHIAAAFLQKIADIPKDLALRMFEARGQCASRSTQEIVSSNSKTFECGTTRVAISQIEYHGVEALLSRTDLCDALSSLLEAEGTEHAFLSLLDPIDARTWLYACSCDTRDLLCAAIGVEFDGNVSVVDRILLRKLDLVPPIVRFCEGRSRS